MRRGLAMRGFVHATTARGIFRGAPTLVHVAWTLVMNALLLLALTVFVAAVAVGAVMWRRRPKGAPLDGERERLAGFGSRIPPD
jgi:RsiW-degrading membrane proteinase PrsW (M82 family)